MTSSKLSALRHLATRLVPLLACLALANCAQVPRAPDEPVQWQAHRTRVEALDHWTLQGKVGMRSDEHQGSARLHWQQSPASYEVRLSGPLGSGTVLISGTDNNARLEQAGEPPLEAESAEDLLYQATGWVLPLEQLTAWVRGMPARGLPVDKLGFNEHQLLDELHQGGWQLSYANYGLHQDIYLPGRIIAQHPQVRLTLVIHSWRVARD